MPYIFVHYNLGQFIDLCEKRTERFSHNSVKSCLAAALKSNRDHVLMFRVPNLLVPVVRFTKWEVFVRFVCFFAVGPVFIFFHSQLKRLQIHVCHC